MKGVREPIREIDVSDARENGWNGSVVFSSVVDGLFVDRVNLPKSPHSISSTLRTRKKGPT